MELHIRDSNIFNVNNTERITPYIKLIWDPVLQDNDVTVFTDHHLKEAVANNSKIKIAWLMEPPAIHRSIYDFVRNNYNVFNYIFTYAEYLSLISNKFIIIPNGLSEICGSDKQIYQKTKNLSIIVSNKRSTEGHRLRHEIVSYYRKYMDVMGKGYRAIPNKLEGLIQYRYQVVIENSKLDIYFTEKIMDCFFTGVVPIYWGCPSISNFFDGHGIIEFNNINQLGKIIDGLSDKDYNSRKSSIEFNFKKAEDYVCIEKYIFDFLKDKICC